MFTQIGHEVIVANSRRVALIARSQRKTDRSDAEQLARLGRFDPKLLSPACHRGREAQADLQTLRSREAPGAHADDAHHVRGGEGLGHGAPALHDTGLPDARA